MKLLSRVIVEFVLVTEEISIERRTTSGPGSPIRRERKLFSSVIDDGAVDIRWASYDTGEHGEGKEEWLVEYGLIGIVGGPERMMEVASGAIDSDWLMSLREGAVQSGPSDGLANIASLLVGVKGMFLSTVTSRGLLEMVSFLAFTVVGESKLKPLSLVFVEGTSAISDCGPANSVVCSCRGVEAASSVSRP